MEDWTEKINDEQKCLMRILSGFITDTAEIMNLMTKGMDDKLNYYVRLGYVETIIKALGLEEKNDRD